MNEQQTLVAVYDTTAHADAAVRDLKSAHVPDGSISQHVKNRTASGTVSETGASAREPGFWAKLFGTEPNHDEDVYDRSIDSGSTVVTVRTPGDRYDQVSAILEKHGPVDLDARAAQYKSSETTTNRTTIPPATGERGTATTTPAAGARSTAHRDDGTIELAQESLSVGKRDVTGGTTRIRRYSVATPVEEQVSLRTEKVTMDRRPVTDGRAVADGNFTDKTIEMQETSEQAVVSKNARVKEEVSLRKEASDRVETVKDSVRHDEVEVEKVPGKQRNTRPDAPMPVQRGGKV